MTCPKSRTPNTHRTPYYPEIPMRVYDWPIIPPPRPPRSWWGEAQRAVLIGALAAIGLLEILGY